MKTLYLHISEPFEERVMYKDDDNLPLNVTGHTSQIKIAKYFGDTSPIVVAGTIETPATNGIFKYSAAASAFTNLKFGTHVYTRYLYNSTGAVVSIVNGQLSLIPTV